MILLNHFHLFISPRPATAKNIQENGHGSMLTVLYNGSIGHLTNQMIITASNAWLLFDIQAWG